MGWFRLLWFSVTKGLSLHAGGDRDNHGDLHRQVSPPCLRVPFQEPLEHGVYLHHPLVRARHVGDGKLQQQDTRKNADQHTENGPTAKHSTAVQHSAAHSTGQQSTQNSKAHRTAQHSTVEAQHAEQHNTAQQKQKAAQHSTSQPSTAQHKTAHSTSQQTQHAEQRGAQRRRRKQTSGARGGERKRLKDASTLTGRKIFQH